MQNLIEDQKMIEHEIHDEMKNSYIDYAMSVIVGRALPDVRDGLKPVPVSYTHLDVYKRQVVDNSNKFYFFNKIF